MNVVMRRNGEMIWFLNSGSVVTMVHCACAHRAEEADGSTGHQKHPDLRAYLEEGRIFGGEGCW